MSHPAETTEDNEKIQLARDIGSELTDGFVAYVRGRVSFDDLTFGMFDALSDLHAVAAGEYELEPLEDEDQESATEQQEDLAQEPARDADGS
jgi:hypothetical protein